ncbi:two-component system histidine kinase PnpS [Thermanaeromonas sp.]|uniref:two-component system histidine kinase PnpS n=1 Tax=Thermanaeromonas sp. TaxID=2003697 RepID=UPI003D16057E
MAIHATLWIISVLLVFYLVLRYILRLPGARDFVGFSGQTGIIFVAFLLVAGAGIYYLCYRLLLPLKTMLPATCKIAAGDLEQRIEVERDDELGVLAKHLNDMVDRLRNNIKEISAERNKIKAILTSLTDAVLAVDQVGRIMFVNPAAEEMLGKKEEEMVRKFLLEVIRSHEMDSLARDILDKGGIREAELRLFPTSSRVFRVHGAPINSEEGRIVGAVLSIRDITELRRLEQVRSEFVANVSHELRTPLTSIRGFVETLLEGALEDENISRRFLTIINSEAQRLQRLIEDLLTLSRLEHEKPEKVVKGASLSRTLNRVLEVVEPLAKEKGVELKVELPPDLPPLKFPENFLEQVLLNLLDNGIKYTPAGGSVTVSAGREGSNIRVEVRDTGIGIPEESLPRIFERFYRVDKARSRELGGTGLGLSIVKHMVESHGGTVGVRSRVGEGSTFYFILPQAEGKEGGEGVTES